MRKAVFIIVVLLIISCCIAERTVGQIQSGETGINLSGRINDNGNREINVQSLLVNDCKEFL